MNNFTIDMLMEKIALPFLYVDFNETDDNCVMLSQHDFKNDYFNNPVKLYEGLKLVGYQEDETSEGTRDDLFVKGTCILNPTSHSNHVKWYIKFDSLGIRCVSEMFV